MNIKISEDENEISFPRFEFVEGLVCVDCCIVDDSNCCCTPCGRGFQYRKDGKIGGFKEASKCH